MVRGPDRGQKCKKWVQVPQVGFAGRGLKSFSILPYFALRIRTCRTLGFAALETAQLKLGLNGIFILFDHIFSDYNSVDQQ